MMHQNVQMQNVWLLTIHIEYDGGCLVYGSYCYLLFDILCLIFDMNIQTIHEGMALNKTHDDPPLVLVTQQKQKKNSHQFWNELSSRM